MNGADPSTSLYFHASRARPESPPPSTSSIVAEGMAASDFIAGVKSQLESSFTLALLALVSLVLAFHFIYGRGGGGGGGGRRGRRGPARGRGRAGAAGAGRARPRPPRC